MRLGHGENEVGTDPGVSTSIRPASRTQANQAQPDHQAPADAHVQVGAGQEADLVRHSDRYDLFGARIQPPRPLTLAVIRASSLLVPVSAQGQVHSGQRPCLRRLRNHVSRRISSLRSLFASPFGPRSPRVPHETDETGRNMALRAGYGMQSDLQTTWSRTGGPDVEVPPAIKPTSDHPNRRSILAGLGLIAGSWLIGKANIPVKIGVASLYPQSCDPKILKFSPAEGEPFFLDGLQYWHTNWAGDSGFQGIERGDPVFHVKQSC